MSMLRSLDSAVSGLKNHQVRMDIIGNNIANVNTVGYKSSRVTFEESLSQLLQGSSRPPGDQGGTNPMQVGLGMSVGSIDSRFSQGNLESTGEVTDLAIEGSAFFSVSNGQGNFYTRNGAFQLDAAGHMVLPTNGFKLQGRLAAADGTFPPGSVIESIKIPLNEQAPAQATENVNFGKNLDSDSFAKGTIHHSQSFTHHTEDTDLLSSLRNSDGRSLGMQAGDVVTFAATHPTTGANATTTFVVQENSTVQDFMNSLQTFLRSPVNGLGVVTSNVELVSLAEDQANGTDFRGGISIFGNNENIQNLQITTNNPLSTGNVAKSLSIASTIPTGATKGQYVSDYLRSPAVLSDSLAELFDGEGNDLGLESGDTISLNGEIGGESANNVTDLIYDDGSSGTPTTMNDIIQKIRDNFKLPERDGTVQNNLSVSLNSSGSDDNIPDGSIVIRGIAGTDFRLENISIRAVNTNNSNPSPVDFNSNLNFNRTQEARDPQVYDTSITVFDESGDDHIMTVSFVPTPVPGNWKWSIDLAGDEIPLTGFQGDLIFDQDGTVASFSFADGGTGFSFDPNNGSNTVRVKLNVGGPGDFSGLTQFRAATTATITGQDGFSTGSLREISINEEGMVNGIFTNGVNKPLAQVMLVDFINPGGLMRVSDSVYSISPNSGDPVFITPGQNSGSVIKPGALEISNVELANEFTSMITTQRGYQANARGITVSDSMLEELVNLKR